VDARRQPHVRGTVFVYEGAPDHPEPDRYCETIDRHGITVFDVSPTAIRAVHLGEAPGDPSTIENPEALDAIADAR